MPNCNAWDYPVSHHVSPGSLLSAHSRQGLNPRSRRRPLRLLLARSQAHSHHRETGISTAPCLPGLICSLQASSVCLVLQFEFIPHIFNLRRLHSTNADFHLPCKLGGPGPWGQHCHKPLAYRAACTGESQVPLTRLLQLLSQSGL
jgi:hypothetical protein